MGQHMLTPPEIGFVDKFKNPRGDGKTHQTAGSFQGDNDYPFVATGAGTTTTLVGDAADLTTSENCLRLGERFMLFDSAGEPKESTVFTVTAHNGTTTVTFSPAAAAATEAGDTARIVGGSALSDMDSLDAALIAVAGYTQLQLDKMNINDKVYAYRVATDPTQWR